MNKLKLLVTYMIIEYINGQILSSAQIQSCDQQSQTKMNCSEKLVILISINQNQIQNQQSLKVSLKQFNDSNNNNYILTEELSITFEKSSTYSIYPLKYQQDFYSRPLETVKSSSIFDCQDGQYSSSPTCGFQYNSKGQKIDDSQGFCCSCSMLAVLGVDQSQLTRGSVCSAFNFGSNSATAHCLSFGSQTYSAYQIQQNYFYYSINIILSNRPSLQIGSNQISASSPDQTLFATLIGSMSLDNPPPSLNQLILLKPSNNLRQYEPIANWLIVNPSQITYDGTGCNLIGVGFKAFRNQNNACFQSVGSCLLNQIEDFYLQDLKNIANNNAAKYMISRFGVFQALQNNQDISLVYINQGSGSSLVRLEMSADNLQYISTVGNGTIDYAKIDNFQSLSQVGTLMYQVTSSCPLPSQFTVTFNCSQFVQQINSQYHSLNAMQSKQNQVSVQTNKQGSDTNNTCVLILLNSKGQFCYTYTVNFTTFQLQTTKPQLDNNTNPYTNQQNTQPQKSTATCDQLCSFYNILCQISNSCTSMIVQFVFIILAFLFGIFLFGFLRNWIQKKKKRQAEKKEKKSSNDKYKQDISIDILAQIAKQQKIVL